MIKRCCEKEPILTLFLAIDKNTKQEFAVCQDHLDMIQNDYQKQFDEYEIKIAEYEERLTQYKSLGVHVPHNMTKQNEKRGDISLNLTTKSSNVDLNLNFLNKGIREPISTKAMLEDSLDK